MRELVFTLEYEPEADPVAEALASSPETTVRSLSCHATAESLWRVDHAAGPSASLDAVEAAVRSDDYWLDCLAADDCGADSETRVLDRRETRLVLYSYWERRDRCESIPHFGRQYLGDGLLFESTRRGRRHRWRIIHDGSGDVERFFAAVKETLGDRATTALQRLADLTSDRQTDESPIPPEQREAVREAVQRGYYETPRDLELSELAAELDIPRSTLSYRLRRAEAQVMKQFVDASPPVAPADYPRSQ